MVRVEKAIAAGLTVMVLVAVTWLVAGPASRTHDDIAAQRHLLAEQLAATKQLLQLQREQLALSRRQLAVSSEATDIARQTRDTARQLLTVARSTQEDSTLLTELSRQLLAFARAAQRWGTATERHAANLDRKVP